MMWQNWIEKIVDWIVPVLCTIIIGGFCIAAGFSRGCELKEQAEARTEKEVEVQMLKDELRKAAIAQVRFSRSIVLN